MIFLREHTNEPPVIEIRSGGTNTSYQANLHRLASSKSEVCKAIKLELGQQ
jgi:hypothetical protein